MLLANTFPLSATIETVHFFMNFLALFAIYPFSSVAVFMHAYMLLFAYELYIIYVNSIFVTIRPSVA